MKALQRLTKMKSEEQKHWLREKQMEKKFQKRKFNLNEIFTTQVKKFYNSLVFILKRKKER
jgi:hypothetical protein